MNLVQRIILFTLLAAASTASNAAIVWSWSFGSNAGQFTTTGTAVAGIASAGTYSVTDFAVTSSGTGATIGSWSGGQYDDAGFATNSPYSLVWDGAVVTDWGQSGGNTFDWLVFDDLLNSNHFFFGWQTGNINTAMQAVYYPASTTSSALSIAVANVTVVSEPGTIVLLSLAIAISAFASRRKVA